MIDDVIKDPPVLTSDGEDVGVSGLPYWGGGGGEGAVLSIALNNIISKIGWGHLMGQPPRGGPTAYQN